MPQTPSWEEDFRRAQKVWTVIINSREYERVRYGQEEEYWLYEKGNPCDDCGVTRGNFHLLGCDLEVCARCGGQLISCDCFYDKRPGGDR
jgi:hypothetical protein